MLTEEEAKTKWCPFAREADGTEENAVAANRTVSGKPFTPCLGSGCMAWRWESVERLFYRPEGRLTGIGDNNWTFWHEPERPSFINEAWFWDAARGLWYVGAPKAAVGRCGLAGPPT